ncbi:MAG: hypothetical protein U0931_11465 [Vulcanimicrobiota bacterium]
MISVQRHHFLQAGSMGPHNCWVPPQMQTGGPSGCGGGWAGQDPWMMPFDPGSLQQQPQPRMSSLSPEQQGFLENLQSSVDRRQEVSQRLQQLGYHKVDQVIRAVGDESTLWTNEAGARISVDGDGNMKKVPSFPGFAGVVKALG